MLELLVPEGANEDFGTLWNADHLGDGPHQGSVDPHQLLKSMNRGSNL